MISCAFAFFSIRSFVRSSHLFHCFRRCLRLFHHHLHLSRLLFFSALVFIFDFFSSLFFVLPISLTLAHVIVRQSQKPSCIYFCVDHELCWLCVNDWGASCLSHIHTHSNETSTKIAQHCRLWVCLIGATIATLFVAVLFGHQMAQNNSTVVDAKVVECVRFERQIYLIAWI